MNHDQPAHANLALPHFACSPYSNKKRAATIAARHPIIEQLLGQCKDEEALHPAGMILTVPGTSLGAGYQGISFIGQRRGYFEDAVA